MLGYEARLECLFRAKILSLVFTIEMSHRSGLIGQQTEIVVVILNLFLDMLEFGGDVAAAVT